MKKLWFLGSLLICLSVKAYDPQQELNNTNNAWSRIHKPSDHISESVGSYSNGCLLGGEVLPEQGQGYIDVRRHRNRYYGQPELIGFIYDLGEQINQQYSRNLLIGDLSQPQGGRMHFGHSSHQVGLDVDIWLQTLNKNQTPRANRSMQTVVNKAEGNMLAPLEMAISEAIILSAKDNRVARLFINPIIKQDFCRRYPQAPWLNKLRPWWGHDEHFHVRLHCPSGSSSCVEQSEVPQGSGCNADLQNWVDEQSDIATGRKKIQQSNKVSRPKLIPMQCSELLQNQ